MQARLPVLPNFLIIGGMRCGSTTLANILNSQQDVLIPENKELHYFDQRNPEIPSVVEYGRHFFSAENVRHIGEATPDYLTTAGCARRISRDLPGVKLIAILRDPVRRAWSHYRFSVASGFEIEPFDKALRLETERLAHPIHLHDIYFSYQQRGRYIEHIQAYLRWFKPEQLHIVVLEELLADPENSVAKLFRFLNLDGDDQWRPWLRITNQASLINLTPQDGSRGSGNQHFKFNRDTADFLNSRSVKFVPQSVRDYVYRKVESRLGHGELPDPPSRKMLKHYFAPYNQSLVGYLGRQLPWL